MAEAVDAVVIGAGVIGLACAHELTKRLDSVVVIDGARIRAVGTREDVDVPRGAEIVDLAGRWLLPGFADAHAHVAMMAEPSSSKLWSPTAEAALRSQLALGITTIRNPGGPTDVAVGLRDAVDLLTGMDSVALVQFTDIDVVRHNLVTRIVRAYEARDKANETAGRDRDAKR